MSLQFSTSLRFSQPSFSNKHRKQESICSSLLYLRNTPCAARKVFSSTSASNACGSFTHDASGSRTLFSPNFLAQVPQTRHPIYLGLVTISLTASWVQLL